MGILSGSIPFLRTNQHFHDLFCITVPWLKWWLKRRGVKVSSSLLAWLAWIIGLFHFLIMWITHFCSWREFYTKYVLYFLLWPNPIHQLNDLFGCQICVEILFFEDQWWCLKHDHDFSLITWDCRGKGRVCGLSLDVPKWKLAVLEILLFLGLSRCAEYICSALSASINKILLCAPALLTYLFTTGKETQKCVAAVSQINEMSMCLNFRRAPVGLLPVTCWLQHIKMQMCAVTIDPIRCVWTENHLHSTWGVTGIPREHSPFIDEMND